MLEKFKTWWSGKGKKAKTILKAWFWYGLYGVTFAAGTALDNVATGFAASALVAVAQTAVAYIRDKAESEAEDASDEVSDLVTEAITGKEADDTSSSGDDNGTADSEVEGAVA